MRSGRRTWLTVMLIVGLALAGCGGDETGTNGDSTRASDSTTGEAGDGGVEGGDGQGGDGAGATYVAGVTVPLAPSAEAVATTESGPVTIAQFIVPLDEQQATIDFYDDWTSSRSDGYQRTASESGGVSWQNAPDAGGEKHIIAVLSPLEGDGFVTVTVTVGPAE